MITVNGKLVTVTMLTEGPNKNRAPGSTVEVDEKRADALVKGEHAEPAEKPKPKRKRKAAK